MITELLVGDAAVEVIIHGLDQCDYLVVFNCETHSFEHVVEFVYFDVSVPVRIDLFEHIDQSYAFLVENLDQVVEYFVEKSALFLVALHFFYFRFEVTVVESFNLFILDDTVVVVVNVLE